ncbi:MAG: hypothetical protein EP332_06990 [Bacteroidetes bacterium]|nr:MAG: hypothetical protein EP332_06990 [Bacteroidota bacterium]
MKYVLILCTALLFACEPSVRTEVIDVPCMGVGYIYKWDTVKAYLTNTDPNIIRLSASYVAKAEKLEETNPQGALMAYKRAIALSPDAEAYLDLVRFLEKSENEIELKRVLEFLVERVDRESAMGKRLQKEQKELILRLLISYINNNEKVYDEWFLSYEDDAWPASELVPALEEDERIKMDKSSLTFQAILFNLGDETYREKVLSSGRVGSFMLSSLSAVSDTLEVGIPELQSFDYGNGDEEDVFLPLTDYGAMFYRALPKKYTYGSAYNLVTRILLNSPDEVGLVYALDSSFAGVQKDERCVAYYFTRVNQDNFQMSEPVCIAYQTPDTVVTCSIHGYEMFQEKYAKVWEPGFKPRATTNRLLRLEPVDTVVSYLYGNSETDFD